MDNPEKMEKLLCNSETELEVENLKRPVSTIEIESLNKNLSVNKRTGPDSFT